MNEEEFDATREFCSHLEKAPDVATACSLEDGREEQRLRKMILPIWLQPGQEPPDVNEVLAQMQALKAAAPEHVRWRSLHAPGDILSVSIFNQHVHNGEELGDDRV